MFDFGDGHIKVLPHVAVQKDQTMFALIEQTAQKEKLAFEFKDYKDLGRLVTRIGDKKNGNGNKYWQFWVDNISPSVGADAYKVIPGTAIEWKFINFQND